MIPFWEYTVKLRATAAIAESAAITGSTALHKSCALTHSAVQFQVQPTLAAVRLANLSAASVRNTPMPAKQFSPKVAEKLGYYVYLYINPLNNTVFYVGKGQGNRAFAHLYDTSESQKVATVREILAQGREPIIEILIHGLKDEEAAFRIESVVIDLLGKANLTNQVRGWGSRIVGRMSTHEVENLYDAEPVEVSEPAILIRINRLYRSDMSNAELYDATRGVWKLGERRNAALYAFAVYRGVVREVYKISSWHPAGTTKYETRIHDNINLPERWEFVGEVADNNVRNKYIDKSVAAQLGPRSQAPVIYVNC